jgi:hypothetical protein
MYRIFSGSDVIHQGDSKCQQLVLILFINPLESGLIT